MKVLGSLLASFLCVAITVPFGRAHAGDARYVAGGPMYCQSVGDGPLYISGIFVMTYAAEGVDNAFTQELIAKYGFKGSTTCAWANAQTPIENVQQDIQRIAEQVRATGRDVVETNWVYVPEAVTLARFCFAYDTVAGVTTAYATDILELPGTTTTQDLKQTWDAYIKMQHANAYPQCFLLPPGEMKQRNYTSALEQWNAKNYRIERVAWNVAGSAAGGDGGPAAASDPAASEAPGASASSTALSAAAASTAGNAERSYFCYGYSADNKTQYLTPLAPVPASVPGTDAANYVGNVVSSAWRAYVQGELGQGPAAYAMCSGGDQTAQVQAFRQQVVRTGPSGSAVTKEIDWHL